MNILVLNGSFRENGGTATMVKAFCEGAREAGHAVSVVNVAHLDIHGCRGCEYCHGAGDGTCVQRDDMDCVYPLWDAADMIVIASPVYYGSFSGQMHSAINRTYAGLKPKRCRKMALFLCSGAHGVYQQAEGIYRTYLADWFGAQDCGVFEATTSEAKSPEMTQQLHAFGARLQ